MKRITIDPGLAIRAVTSYNRGRYRGRPNREIDRDAYNRFHSGLASEMTDLIEPLRFVGEEYGGAQARFIPHGYRQEATLIATQLASVQQELSAVINGLAPLSAAVPSPEILARLLAARP